MTKLLQEAFTMVSTKFNQEEQDRFAHLIMENINKLYEILDEAEERSFDSIASTTIDSEKIQNLLKRVTEKHKNRQSPNVSLS
jgi:hypothetical protein